MAFKFCPECGFKFDKEYKFCPECGFKLDEKTEKMPEPLFDFSDDTAKYADEKFVGLEEQLRRQEQAERAAAERAAARPKSYTPITDENKLRLEELTFVSDLKDADYEMASAMDSEQRYKDEDELVEQFNKYFNEYKELSTENGIELKRNVSPEYFGAHQKCKPVQFLFRKNGNDKLAVLIVSKNNYGHPAVRNILKKCREKVKCIVFFLYMPNTEHYVMRRVLEELGLIDRVY